MSQAEETSAQKLVEEETDEMAEVLVEMRIEEEEESVEVLKVKQEMNFEYEVLGLQDKLAVLANRLNFCES